ncbi:putative tetratricopeptide-like helical domain superfamily, protein NPG1 [Helianthus anomalus]
MKLTSRMKMTRFKTFWIQMWKNKPLDESHKTGLLFEAQSLHNEALIAFSVALSIEPDYVPSIISTAEIFMKMGGSETLPIARSFLMNSLRLEPTNHHAWFNLALICKKEGLEQQAADFFQAAHELESSAPVQSFV